MELNRNDGQVMAPMKGDNSAQSLSDIVIAIDERVRQGDAAEFRPISSGLGELDAAIGGGFRLGQLALLSGPAGVGKTSLMLQIARNIAASDQAVCLFVCYEHETDYLAQRLIAMESVSTGDGTPSDGLRLKDIEELVRRYSASHPGQAGFTAAVGNDLRGARALERIKTYGERLLLMKGSTATTVETLVERVREICQPGGPAYGKPVVLFVDYLQKIATLTPHTAETARNIEEVEGLKELALDEDIVVVAIVAAEVEGLKAQRLRLQHLLASSAIAYEADLILLMNEKFDIVDRRHGEFHPHNAEQYHQYVVLSVEKNRAGSGLIDLELRKQLQFCHFRPDVRRVEEKLISGRRRE